MKIFDEERRGGGMYSSSRGLVEKTLVHFYPARFLGRKGRKKKNIRLGCGRGGRL